MTGAAVVHVVDDDESFRKAVSRLLKTSGYQVADYESAAGFLQASEEARPGCILLDVQMPALGGLQLQEQLAKLSRTWPIIFLTGRGDIPTSVRAIKAGAEDFLSKPVSKQILLEAIERALARYGAIKQSQYQLNSFKSLISTLTPREDEVFALMVRGKLNKQIAFQLGTSERTVKAHRRMVMHKLQVHSFAEAACREVLCCVVPTTTDGLGEAAMENAQALTPKIKSRSCRDLVEQAENLAFADLEQPPHIPDLCRALGVSDRTLRKAFHKIRGIPPSRHLRMTRLLQARWTLLSANCKLVTVTDVATCFGFVELGRFSVEYRKVFGESPSQTLHRAFPVETDAVPIDAWGGRAKLSAPSSRYAALFE